MLVTFNLPLKSKYSTSKYVLKGNKYQVHHYKNVAIDMSEGKVHSFLTFIVRIWIYRRDIKCFDLQYKNRGGFLEHITKMKKQNHNTHMTICSDTHTISGKSIKMMNWCYSMAKNQTKWFCSCLFWWWVALECFNDRWATYLEGYTIIEDVGFSYGYPWTLLHTQALINHYSSESGQFSGIDLQD